MPARGGNNRAKSVSPLSLSLPPSNGYGSNVGSVTIKRFSNQAGVTFAGAPTVSVTPEINGVPMIKMETGLPGPNYEIEIPVVPSSTAPRTGTLVWIMYVPDPSAVAQVTFFAGPTGFPNWWIRDYTINATQQPQRERSGWHAVELDRQAGTSTGGFNFLTDTINVTKARVVPAIGRTATVYFYAVTLKSISRPAWVICFDDNRETILTGAAAITLRGVPGTYSGKQIVDAYGFKPTVYCVVDQTQGSLTGQQIKSLYDSGWDIQAQHFQQLVGNSSINPGLHGSRLLGPYGFSGLHSGPLPSVADPRLNGATGLAAAPISSVNPANDQFTTAANHIIPPQPGIYSFPIEFTGTNLPVPLSTGVRYWARWVSNNVFTLHSTEQGSIQNTNLIDITSAGTPANFSYRYWGSAPDDSAILADFNRLNDYVEALGIPRPRHLAVGQGALDKWVMDAAIKAGYLSVRTTQNDASARTVWLPTAEDAANKIVWTANSSFGVEPAVAQSVIEGYVDAVIARNSIGFSYTHDVDTTSGQRLAWLCDYLFKKRAQGQIDVLTMSQVYNLASE